MAKIRKDITGEWQIETKTEGWINAYGDNGVKFAFFEAGTGKPVYFDTHTPEPLVDNTVYSHGTKANTYCSCDPYYTLPVKKEAKP